jgi:hypothetical protein
MHVHMYGSCVVSAWSLSRVYGLSSDFCGYYSLGYLLAITALAVGIYMAVKRGGRIIPLILGVVLAFFSLAALAVLVAGITAYPDAKIETIEIRH